MLEQLHKIVKKKKKKKQDSGSHTKNRVHRTQMVDKNIQKQGMKNQVDKELIHKQIKNRRTAIAYKYIKIRYNKLSNLL